MKIDYKSPEVKVVMISSCRIMNSISATNEAFGFQYNTEDEFEEEDI